MAKNKDIISAEIDLRTSSYKARKEIDEFKNATKQLQKQNQQHRKSISDLTKTDIEVENGLFSQTIEFPDFR